MPNLPVFAWQPSDRELVRAWLSFKVLFDRKEVWIEFDSEASEAAHGFWNARGSRSYDTIVAKLQGDPYDFLIGYSAGLEPMIEHDCVEPSQFPDIVLASIGRDIEEICGAGVVGDALRSLSRRPRWRE